jgi:ADP-ribose pyrophosphatase YjhB (NUDIX family)
MDEGVDRYAQLPKYLAAASALFHDPDGRVLLVKPTYRDGWLLPGGGMEPVEYPWETTRREVKEELALELEGEPRLLAVDWTRPRPGGRPGLVAFVFDGGMLTEQQAKERITLPPEELSAWDFVAPDDWPAYVSVGIARRLASCGVALIEERVLYLQDGRLDTDT